MKVVLLFVLSVMALCSYSQGRDTTTPPMSKDFLQTNGEFVKIGGIYVRTNSPLNTDDFKQYKWRVDQALALANSSASNATDLFVDASWALVRDYPQSANGYQSIMEAIDDYEWEGQTAKARLLAQKLIDFPMPANSPPTVHAYFHSHPEQFKLWARGFLNRLDSYNKPISMQFTAVDGREVDLSKMRGHVVLVDFWSTGCGPCRAELPKVNAAYQKFHDQGFEVIGVSCDTDKETLRRFLKKSGYPWPQYFDGKQQGDNKFTTEFGIDGIPHMFLIDKKGLLRFDDVRASDIHSKGDTLSFEDKISTLLAEQVLP